MKFWEKRPLIFYLWNYLFIYFGSYYYYFGIKTQIIIKQIPGEVGPFQFILVI